MLLKDALAELDSIITDNPIYSDYYKQVVTQRNTMIPLSALFYNANPDEFLAQLRVEQESLNMAKSPYSLWDVLSRMSTAFTVRLEVTDDEFVTMVTHLNNRFRRSYKEEEYKFKPTPSDRNLELLLTRDWFLVLLLLELI